MNQVDRRQREQLLSEELALLKSCGSEIRQTDQGALALARIKGNTTSAERFFKVRRTRRLHSDSIVSRTWDLLKAHHADGDQKSELAPDNRIPC